MRSAVAEFLDRGGKADGECRIRSRERRGRDRGVASLSIGGTVQMREGHVTGVSMKSTSITDRELAIFTKLPQLEELSLRNTEISEVGVYAPFRSRFAAQAGSRVHALLSDGALGQLKPLVNLETLSLPNTQVEGLGLAALAGLTKLRELECRKHASKNEALQHIAKLTGLERLALQYTDVTDRRYAGARDAEKSKAAESRGRRYSGRGAEESCRNGSDGRSGSQFLPVYRKRTEGARRAGQPEAAGFESDRDQRRRP